MSAVDSQWMPKPGRHSVNLGGSLNRALKTRKGEVVQRKGKIPTSDFYSFKYKFKPESIDPGRTSHLQVTRGKDSTTVKVERPSTQSGESHVFVGNEAPAKDWECVLVYDEETGIFTLEKIDSFINLNYDRRETGKGGSALSPPSGHSAGATPSASAPLADDEPDAEGELDEEEGEIPEGPMPSAAPHRREEEEEEEDGEEVPLAVTLTKSKGRATNPKAKAPSSALLGGRTKTVKPAAPAKSLSEHAESRHARSKKAPSSTATTMNAPPPPPPQFPDVEEEVLEFGRPAQQPNKRRKPSPKPASPPPELEPEPVDFALPGRGVSSGRPPSAPQLAQQSDSEDEWEEVDATAQPAVAAVPGGGVLEIRFSPTPADGEEEDAGERDAEGEEDEGEDDLMKELEQEMHQQLDEDGEGEGEEEDDFLTGAMEGAGADFDADDYSSSDESDED